GSRALLEYLYRLLDSRERKLNSVVNEMYEVMLKYKKSKEETSKYLAPIEYLRRELS
ncbi:hypothetical protein MKW92_004364, partial [Papaver armeniacum]